jgi:hypothetical protein
LFEKLKRSSAVARLVEEQLYEQLYEQVALELSNGERREGLWAKALANSAGDDQKATGLYIKYRVQAMNDEAEVMEGLADAAQAEALVQVDGSAKQLEQKRARECEVKLIAKGCKLKSKSNGWIVIEPLGGREHIDTIASLELYTESRD